MSSSPTPEVDFGRIAPRYDELRNIGERWPELVDVLVQEGDLRGRRVLDVGSGTGRLASLLVERYGCKVWGVDPEPEMIEVARAKVPPGRRAEDRPCGGPALQGRLVRARDDDARPPVGGPAASLCRSDSRPAAGRPARACDVRLRPLRALLPRRLLPLVRGAGQGAIPLRGRARAGAPGRRFRARPADAPDPATRRSTAKRCSSASAASTSRPSSSSPTRSTASGLERAERELPDEVENVLEWIVAAAGR